MAEDDKLAGFLALASDSEDDEAEDTFFTCKQDRTVNRTMDTTANDTFYTIADNTQNSTLDSIDEADEDRSMPCEPENDDKRLTLTEQEAREACKLPSRNVSPVKPKLSEMVQEAPKKPQLGIKKAEVAPAAPAVTAYDNFFALKVKNPKVSSLSFESLTDDMKKVRLMQLHLNKDHKGVFVTMGVIVEKGEIKKSANGNEYLIWKLHDLKNCQDKSVKLLLFGEACKENWKLQAGSTVALVGPQFGDQPTNSKDPLTLKVAKRSQVIEIGQCLSYGHCKSVCQNGAPCSNFVNIDSSDYCVYHVMSEARKLSSKRGVFNNVSAVASKRTSTAAPHQIPALMSYKPVRSSMPLPAATLNASGTMKTTTGMVAKPLDGKIVTKAEEKEQLKQMLAERANLSGARNLQLLEARKNSQPEEKEVKKCHASMANFIQKQEAEKKEAAISRAPKLGFGLRGPSIDLGKPGAARKGCKDAEAEAARLRAIAILKAKRPGLKRPSTDDDGDGTPIKRRQLGAITNKDEIEKLLKKKSLHDDEAKNEEKTAEERYFNGMTSKEKVESFTTSCMAVKDVKVVTCKKCNYTSQHQAEYCMQQGHPVTKHQAEKRFYKCGSCSKRVTVFGLVPIKPCQSCEATDWQRVGMRDERKVVLETEKLQLRGEERKFVNV